MKIRLVRDRLGNSPLDIWSMYWPDKGTKPKRARGHTWPWMRRRLLFVMGLMTWAEVQREDDYPVG